MLVSGAVYYNIYAIDAIYMLQKSHNIAVPYSTIHSFATEISIYVPNGIFDDALQYLWVKLCASFRLEQWFIGKGAL